MLCISIRCHNKHLLLVSYKYAPVFSWGAAVGPLLMMLDYLHSGKWSDRCKGARSEQQYRTVNHRLFIRSHSGMVKNKVFSFALLQRVFQQVNFHVSLWRLLKLALRFWLIMRPLPSPRNIACTTRKLCITPSWSAVPRPNHRNEPHKSY